MQIYDVIIIGAGGAGLFTALSAPKQYKKLLLEKNKNPGVKVLLSGGERANVSNIDIEPLRDYFGQNTKALLSLFRSWNQYDTISFFEENGVKIIEEDRGRLILESGDSRELLELLLKKAKQNNTQIEGNMGVIDIKKNGDIFEVLCQNDEIFQAKKIVITTGGRSFSQVGTTGDGYAWARDFGHTIIHPHRGLCGMVTKKDLSEISGVSSDVDLKVVSSFKGKKKVIYSEVGPILFTHFGVSGPIIFNSAVAIGEYMNSFDREEIMGEFDLSHLPENEISDGGDREFIKKYISLEITFGENIAKRLEKFFDIGEENRTYTLELQDYRTWKEAKVTGGGVSLDELDNHLQSKKVPNLYFAGEVLDITGKTGGFNLQFAWTSGFVIGKNL